MGLRELRHIVPGKMFDLSGYSVEESDRSVSVIMKEYMNGKAEKVLLFEEIGLKCLMGTIST